MDKITDTTPHHWA